MNYSATRIYKCVKESYRLAKQRLPAYSGKFSKRRYTLHQHMALLCLKAKLGRGFEEVEELAVNMPHVCAALELGDDVPDGSTLCRQFHRLKPSVLLILMVLAAGMLPGSGKAAIDATGFDRRHCSKHYVKRAKLHIGSLKVTFVVDTVSQMILALHTTATRKHDTRILPPTIRKTRQHVDIEVLAADKGFDAKPIRDWLRKIGVRPLIKHREFTALDKAHNARIKKDDYNQRVKTETVNSSIKRKYTDTLTTKTYWNQVREIHLIALVYNIERAITRSLERIAIKLLFFVV